MRFLVWLLSALCLGGCASTIDFPWPSHSKSGRVADEKISLTLFPNGDDDSTWSKDVPPAIVKACSSTESAGSYAVNLSGGPKPSVASALVSVAIDFAVSQLAAAIKEEAESYQATFSGRIADEFYQYGTAQDGKIPRRLNFSCFRMRRTVGEATNPGLAFDFVGKFVPSIDQYALGIVPLYVKYPMTKAKVGNGGRYEAAIDIAVEAVWADRRQSVVSIKGDVFRRTIALGQLVLGGATGDVIVSCDKNGALDPRRRCKTPSVWLPAIPVSMNQNNELAGTGPFVMTVTVTETAAAKDLAGKAADLAIGAINKGAAAAKGGSAGN